MASANIFSLVEMIFWCFMFFFRLRSPFRHQILSGIQEGRRAGVFVGNLSQFSGRRLDSDHAEA
jgi:hypothetical protein